MDRVLGNEYRWDVKKKKAKQRKRAQAQMEVGVEAGEGPYGGDTDNVEEQDHFEVEEGGNLEIEMVKEGMPIIQDLLLVIKSAHLSEALPQVVKLLEIAVTTPLTSVHCERVFSRMKRVVSAARSRMLQTRKENLVFLQVEHRLLRLLEDKPSFKDNVVNRFKSMNRRRHERFSRNKSCYFQIILSISDSFETFQSYDSPFSWKN